MVQIAQECEVFIFSASLYSRSMLIHFLEEQLFRRRRQTSVIQTLLIDLSAVFIWRGTWGLMDTYLFPTYPNFSFVFSILVGVSLVLFLRQYNRR